jgi:hypothetical protein
LRPYSSNVLEDLFSETLEASKEGQGISPALHVLVLSYKVLAKPYYAGTGRGLKPDMDSAVAVVVAVAAIAVAVIAVPIAAAVRIGQVTVTINGLTKGISGLLYSRLLVTTCAQTARQTNPETFCLGAVSK